MMLPASLTSLTIRDFPNLEFLSSKGFQKVHSLMELTIRNCRKLTSLPKDGLPLSIQILLIRDCPLLKERCKKKGHEGSMRAHILRVEFDGEVFKPEAGCFNSRVLNEDLPLISSAS
ncbi:hypothetical protein CJ030_MR5G009700 [Morella rubra]|uniref:Uncharacterized protein n=1 Tax=Morella rubra TaxID=262757 RepID=A0A6A1VLH3_9ROSI|nr:hypothetical protein CJ030_MR5G009700 [Morella rubra]